MKHIAILTPIEIAFVITIHNDEEVDFTLETMKETFQETNSYINRLVEGITDEVKRMTTALDIAKIKYTLHEDWLDDDWDLVPGHENEEVEAVYF